MTTHAMSSSGSEGLRVLFPARWIPSDRFPVWHTGFVVSPANNGAIGLIFEHPSTEDDLIRAAKNIEIGIEDASGFPVQGLGGSFTCGSGEGFVAVHYYAPIDETALLSEVVLHIRHPGLGVDFEQQSQGEAPQV